MCFVALNMNINLGVLLILKQLNYQQVNSLSIVIGWGGGGTKD